MITILNKIRLAGGSITVLAGRVRIESPPGTITDQDRAVLSQHKQDLLRLFAPTETLVDDPDERRAIQWAESLTPAEREVVVAEALRDWDEIVEGVKVESASVTTCVEFADGGLRLHCPTPEAAAAIETCRSKLETIFEGWDTDMEADLDAEYVEDPDRWLAENTIPLPAPCSKCESVDRWQDVAGGWHCAKCDPPIRSQIIREQAKRLRRQAQTSDGTLAAMKPRPIIKAKRSRLRLAPGTGP